MNKCVKCIRDKATGECYDIVDQKGRENHFNLTNRVAVLEPKVDRIDEDVKGKVKKPEMTGHEYDILTLQADGVSTQWTDPTTFASALMGGVEKIERIENDVNTLKGDMTTVKSDIENLKNNQGGSGGGSGATIYKHKIVYGDLTIYTISSSITRITEISDPAEMCRYINEICKDSFCNYTYDGGATYISGIFGGLNYSETPATGPDDPGYSYIDFYMQPFNAGGGGFMLAPDLNKSHEIKGV